MPRSKMQPKRLSLPAKKRPYNAIAAKAKDADVDDEVDAPVKAKAVKTQANATANAKAKAKANANVKPKPKAKAKPLAKAAPVAAPASAAAAPPSDTVDSSSEEDVPKRKYKGKTGTAALRQILHEQRETEPVFPKATISRAVRQIDEELHGAGNGMRWAKEALVVLHHVTEAHVIKAFEEGEKFSANRKVQTLSLKDFTFGMYALTGEEKYSPAVAVTYRTAKEMRAVGDAAGSEDPIDSVLEAMVAPDDGDDEEDEDFAPGDNAADDDDDGDKDEGSEQQQEQ